MGEKLEDIPTPADFKNRIKNLLFFLQLDYTTLVAGRGSPREKKLCQITKELEAHYQKTGDKEYKKVKDQALISYSKIVMGCNKHGSNYGKNKK